MRIRIGWPGAKGLVVLVAVLGVAAVFVPVPWTAPLRASFARGLAAGAEWLWQGTARARAVAERAWSDPAPAPAGDRHEVEELRNRLVFMDQRVAELTEQLRDLTRIRAHLDLGGGQLVPAFVSAGDASGLRDTLLIRPNVSGAAAAVGTGDWVIAPLHPGETTRGAISGMARLAGCVVIGSVSQPGAGGVRVRLLSDPTSVQRVSIMRVRDGQVEAIDRGAILSGLGGGRMEISDLRRDLGIRVGDLVVSEPTAGRYGGLIIGQVGGLEEHVRPRLLLRAQVVPLRPYDQLQRVYVLTGK